MSSHREAPEISKDPVADSTDLYAFVSPDAPDTVTLIANYIPLEGPDAGPNFFEFGDDVLYEIKIDNNGDGVADVIYQFQFKTEVRNPETFLYNTGPITSLDSGNWNRRQFYTVTRYDDQGHRDLGKHLASPPCNIGPRSTPNYGELAKSAVHTLSSGEKVFAGQRLEGFYIDLGAVFDLAVLRPFENLHLIPTPVATGVDATKNVNVHSIAIQVPKKLLTHDGSSPSDPKSKTATIGVWTTANRRKAQVREGEHDQAWESGPWLQVSRLGNPLFNEVIVPMGKKDRWNKLQPKHDNDFAVYVKQPELAKLLPILYPNVFPNLAALKADRADLVAILLTGIPAGIIPGFQNNTGTVQADMLRLNMAYAPSQSPKPLGLLAGDLDGFPNGRRVGDDVFTIELRAVAGATYPLVSKGYTVDAAVNAVTDGVSPAADRFIATFPYLGVPVSGFDQPK